MKKNRIIALLILGIVLFTACANKSSDKYETMEAKEDMAVQELRAPAKKILANSAKLNIVKTERKIIQNSYIEMETLNFEDTIEKIKMKTFTLNGYFENMRIDGKRIIEEYYPLRTANFVIRIPKDKNEEIINSFDDFGNITVNEINSTDVTEQYVDTEARLKALLIQETRLLEIMKTAKKIEDIIKLEKRISEIRYKIEGYQGSINKWDNLVEFTTIRLQIYEVRKVTEPEPEGLISKAINSFTNSIENLKLFLQSLVILAFALVPFLVLIIPAAFVVLHISKKTKINIKHKSKNINQKKDNENNKD